MRRALGQDAIRLGEVNAEGNRKPGHHAGAAKAS